MIFFCVCVSVFGRFFMGKKDEFGRNNGLGCSTETFLRLEARMGRKWWVDGSLEGLLQGGDCSFFLVLNLGCIACG